MNNDYLIKLREKCQGELKVEGEVLTDTNAYGQERPWRLHKMQNMSLAEIYEAIDPIKAQRLKDCGKLLQFRVFADGTKKLHTMSSCRVRLCPLCSWRRSLKSFHNTKSLVDRISQEHDYKYIFLTLTVKNCKSYQLSDTVDEMFKAINRLYIRKEYKKAIKGAVRCFEITHNVDKSSKDFDTYHPHFHFILAVKPSYFKSRDYISQAKWSEIWRSVMNLDYTPIVNVKKVYGDIWHACAECSKYACKSVDYLIPDEWRLSVQTVAILDKVLANRRLIAYTGIFRETFKLLQLEDLENGDLVNVGEAEENKNEPFQIQNFFWYSGYRQYICVD